MPNIGDHASDLHLVHNFVIHLEVCYNIDTIKHGPDDTGGRQYVSRYTQELQ